MDTMTTQSMEGSGEMNETMEMPVQRTALQSTVQVILFIVLAIGMFGIGCGVQFEKLASHFKKPTGALIGIASQFLIMPIGAFVLATILQMNEIRTLTLLIMGSCPGGSVSNVVVVWVDGDIDLSVCMTTVSCILAFGVMPLMLWIFSLIYSSQLQVPFQSIGITLVIVLVPMTIGALFRRIKPKVAKILLKVLSALGLVAIIVLIVIAVLTYGKLYSIVVGQVLASLILPLCGLGLGYGLASLVGLYRPWRLKHCQRRTIALETGIQNVQLALGIITLSNFTIQEEAQVVLFPILYLAGQGIWIIIILISYTIYKRVYKKDNTVAISEKDNEESTDSNTSSYKKNEDFKNEAYEHDESPPKYSDAPSYKATVF